MGDLRETISTAVVSELENHKQKNGRRFSTYIEGYGNANAKFELAMANLKTVAQGIDIVWDKIKQDKTDEELSEIFDVIQEHGASAVAYLLSMLAMVEKLRGGVVHEPK